LRIEKTRLRRGDQAQLARISFVDDLKSAPVAKAVSEEKPAKKTAAKPAAAKKPAAKTAKETK
jgi:hypothetical protein